MWRSVSWPTREELYEQVWSRPSEQVAAALGVSGVALAKRCAAWNIPKPPRGYWARRAAGQKIKRPPLPVSDRPRKKLAPPLVPYEAPAVTGAVPWPQVVKATDRAYREAVVDVWGRLEGPGYLHPSLDVTVSREALSRALQLYALIIGGLKRSPVSLVVEKGRTLARAGSDEVRLRIKEEVRAQSDLPLIERKYASSWDTPRQQKAVGTGRLQVMVSVPDRFGFSAYEVQFRDGKVPLEGQLDLILAYLWDIPQRAAERRETLRREDEARLAEQRRREREQARLAALQAECERRQQEEQACHEGLRNLVEQWERTERLRAYLNALNQELPWLELAGTEEYLVWRDWAEEQLKAAPQQHSAQLRSWTVRVAEMTRWDPLE